ncbi:PQQ-like beta-propeller repeat protein, partial [bacterium]|nr:PQQ-like beta-propeller repeat protein [bacterium]
LLLVKIIILVFCLVYSYHGHCEVSGKVKQKKPIVLKGLPALVDYVSATKDLIGYKFTPGKGPRIYDLVIKKIDLDGNIKWSRRLEGIEHIEDLVRSDEGRYFCLSTNPDILWETVSQDWLEEHIDKGKTLFFNSDGKILWEKNFFGVPFVSHNGERICLCRSRYAVPYGLDEGRAYDEQNKPFTAKRDPLLIDDVVLNRKGQEILKEKFRNVVMMSSSGKLFVTATSLKNKKGKDIAKLNVHGFTSISGNDKRIAIGSLLENDKSVYFINNKGKVLWKRQIETHVGAMVKVSKDGRYVLATPAERINRESIENRMDYGGKLYCFNDKGKLLWTFTGELFEPYYWKDFSLMDISARGEYVVAVLRVAYVRQILYCLDGSSGKIQWKYEGPADSRFWRLFVSDDGKQVLATNKEGLLIFQNE